MIKLVCFGLLVFWIAGAYDFNVGDNRLVFKTSILVFEYNGTANR